MIIGVPKEIKDHEYRVSVTPDGVQALRHAGHEVLVEPSAGVGSGYTDEQYRQAGAKIAPSKEALFKDAALIVKVKEPQLSETRLFRPGQVLFTYLHLASSAELTKALLEAGITAIAYETIEAKDGTLPMLKPMSEIAGKMSVQVGARYLEATQGGRGLLLGGVPASSQPRWSSWARERSAARQLESPLAWARKSRSSISTSSACGTSTISTRAESSPASPRKQRSRNMCSRRILLIGAVLVPGARAPKLVSRTLVGKMKPKSVIVDVAVDQGGCIETSRPTTHSDPTYIVEGVLHYCVANMPGIVPRTSTQALTNATLPYLLTLAASGVDAAVRADAGLAKGVNLSQGKVTCRGVAEAHGLRFDPLM